MSASSLQPMRDVCFYVSGHVTVHPDAAIASDVLLQADPDSQIIIHAGVSLGSGSILHASGGVLEIRENTTVGNRVLIVGHGTVGKSACIGAFSTLMLKVDVADCQVLPPSSLLGDASRKIAEPTHSESLNGSERASDQNDTDQFHPDSDQASSDNAAAQNGDRPSSSEKAAEAEKAANTDEAIGSDETNSSLQKNGHVYGRAAVEEMIRVMFPARQYQFGSNNSSASDSNLNSP